MMSKRFGLVLMTMIGAGCPAKEEPAKEAPPASPDQPPNPHGDAFAHKTPPGAPISGLVKLDDGISQSDVKPTDVLFIMVRESQGGGKFGRLVAVQRMGQVEFPKRYEIGASDAMVPGIPFKGPFIVMGRLDRDGDPMTRKPDDLFGLVAKEVQAGDEGLELVLKKATVKDTEPTEGAASPPPAQGAASQPAQ